MTDPEDTYVFQPMSQEDKDLLAYNINDGDDCDGGNTRMTNYHPKPLPPRPIVAWLAEFPVDENTESRKIHLRIYGSPSEFRGELLFRIKTLTGHRFTKIGLEGPKAVVINPSTEATTIVTRSPQNLTLLLKAYYQIYNTKKELSQQWKLKYPYRLELLASDEAHEIEPVRSPRFHELRGQDCPERLDTLILPLGKRGGPLRDAEGKIVGRRFILGRGFYKSPKTLACEAYIDVATGQETTQEPGDLILPENEDTFKMLFTVYQQIEDEDLLEPQPARGVASMRRAHEGDAGLRTPAKKIKR